MDRTRYNDNDPRKGSTLSDDSKSKISNSVKAYAKEHSNELKERAQVIFTNQN